MNERFWELVEQADEQGGDDPDIRDQVFAKLIVQDCRDMFMVGSVSWNLLNEKLEYLGVES